MDENLCGIHDILQQSNPIALNDMDSVSLQNRIDRKYVLHINQVAQLLKEIGAHYFVLDIDEKRLFTYHTIYFDTPNLQFYTDHHNGLLNRIKVRCRKYVESNQTYFEIKRKHLGYRTDKFRKTIDEMILNLGEEEYAQIKNRYVKREVNNLEISLDNYFKRTTLVSKNMTERVTLDFNLSFRKDATEKTVNDIVVIEVKQQKYDETSAVVQALKRARIYPERISKYTFGILMMNEGVKYNSFKKIQRKVTKIQTANGAN